jgi:hypothetical protein
MLGKAASTAEIASSRSSRAPAAVSSVLLAAGEVRDRGTADQQEHRCQKQAAPRICHRGKIPISKILPIEWRQYIA